VARAREHSTVSTRDPGKTRRPARVSQVPELLECSVFLGGLIQAEIALAGLFSPALLETVKV
jgi:hypothetical protein